MIVRLTLAALAAAALAGPLAAAEVSSDGVQVGSDEGSGDAATTGRSRRATSSRGISGRVRASAPERTAEADPAGIDDETVTAKPRSRVRRVARIAVPVLPPARPDASVPMPSPEAKEVSAPLGAAPVPPAFVPVTVGSGPTTIGSGPTTGLGSSPTMNVVSAPVAGAFAAAMGGKTPAFVNVMPPLRPSFAAEEPPLDMASVADASGREVTPNGTAPSRIVSVLPPARPGFAWDEDSGAALPGEVATLQPEPVTQPVTVTSLFGTPLATPEMPPVSPGFAGSGRSGLDSMIASHARANGVPLALVHRVVVRESRYNPGAVGRGGALGLMQIKHGTARALGYMGTASGLLDADTNLTYAVKYLAGAYRISGGDFNRAVAYYARGYYHAAKKAGTIRTAGRSRGQSRDAESDETMLAGTATP